MKKLIENLTDKFTLQRRHFIVKEKNMIEIMKMISLATSKGPSSGMLMGNCRWVKEPDSWYIHTDLTNKQWETLLESCKSNSYQLMIKDIPNRMYFVKVKES